MATKSDCSGCKYNHENWCVLDGMCCFSAVVDALDGKEKDEQDKNDADALKDVMEDMRQHGDY